MRVLTIYAHHDPRSFCHSVLERFTAGLRDAGHTNEVVDLYADKFDPVFRDRDGASYISADVPADILDRVDLRSQVMASCRWPFQRWLAARALRGKTQAQIAALIRSRMPKDVLAQQAKVAAADALAFIAPIHFCSFPSILKGWIDRVWTLDFAFGLTSEGWHGDVNGRIPLLEHQRALIMTSTIFNKESYDAGVRDSIGTVLDQWSFQFPGIQDVEHVYFYAATSASPERIGEYLRQAYDLGRGFDRSQPAAVSVAAEH
ncbi:NAD(P)H-dependent oxidoreductase [Amycolatopsis sp. K13G38]|uniref:NAD(P)H-dependent oxidoreductase n=1 Tax=Amycolatopsis acididurans TaxID=2724524 RepID=A0ABX1JAW9_9PSEU|nr:NAD(P)H-dependent oxidoreductase [Amycolatopsis acididurans]NKQ56938.1 NAD(P)H-dependent oxidoreductase [Amycolatopsis acididurans]